jgi:hypothetical protein
MEKLELEKLSKEIDLLELEIKSKKESKFFNYAKVLIGLIGSIILFLLITRPESLLNQKSSHETINRERAKVLIDIVKEKDPKTRKRSLEILKASYPEIESDWINDIEEQLTIEADNDLKTENKKRLRELESQKDELEYQISSGTVINKTKLRMANQNLRMYEIEIDKLKKEIKKLE